MLVITVFTNEIGNDFVYYWLDIFRGDELMARFNNHSKDFSDFVFLMSSKISDEVGVE